MTYGAVRTFFLDSLQGACIFLKRTKTMITVAIIFRISVAILIHAHGAAAILIHYRGPRARLP